jgi:type VI secretion system secreted protein VgrG
MPRAITVSSPVAGVSLELDRLIAREQLGRPFEFELELFSEAREIDLEQALGKDLTVTVKFGEKLTRYFHGYVASFAQLPRSERGYAWYRAVLRPWLWFLTRSSDCCIFQEKNVPTILREVFDEHGFTDRRESLSGTYNPRTYCVQYCESDFNFVSRLMEQEGLYYFFEHAQGKHTLVLADSASAHSDIQGTSTIPYRPADDQRGFEREHISDWLVQQQVQATSYALKDFDFERPSTNLEARSRNSLQRNHAQSDHEQFDWPGLYTQTADGEAYARVRIEALQAEFEQVSGRGNAPGLAVGGLFTLSEFPRQDQNRQYLITSAVHHIQALEDVDTDRPDYRCEFTAIDNRQPFRTVPTTPKPVVRGPQTAVVVGKSGEEIWTDKYGRVKVQFPWDRYGESNENSSCWVRVAQNWAGKNWGAMHLPRIGQEVIVDFLDGDPDRPIITGRVYNAEQMPPYALPENQNRSTIKSRSTKQGTAETFNELRFDDTKDSEEVYLHAQKDCKREVVNNDSLVVKEGNREDTIEKGNDTLTIKQGNHTIKIEAGKSEITAGTSIELKVGSNSIKIDATGVTISAGMIKLDATGALSASGATAEVKGDTSLVLQGAVVKIN